MLVSSTPFTFLRKLCCVVFVCFFYAQVAQATTYTITSGSYPTCSGSWSVSGTTYTCSGQITLGFGDILSSNTTITVVGNTGFILSGNTIGSSTNNINIQANTGSLNTANSNTIYGNVTTNSAAVNLGNSGQSGWITTVTGSVTSTSGTLTINYSTISGAVSSANSVALTGGSVTGMVTSTGSSVSSAATNLSGGMTAATGITINGGTISGAFTMTQNYTATFANVTMASGSISGASAVTISNSTIGSSSSTVPVTSTAGAVTVNSSTVYGNYTAPNAYTIYVNSSTVTGICLPNSTPANACIVPTCTSGLIGGLTGSYYNNKTLTAPVTGTRVDNGVNFDWGTGSPGVSGIGVDNFSVSWSGNFRAPATGNYQFQTLSDDGVRLYVNNVLVINNWTGHGTATDNSSAISLTAGQSYPIKLEYFEGGGSAVIKLNWLTPNSSTFQPMGTQNAGTPDTSSYCAIPAQSCPGGGLLGGALGKYYNDTGSNLVDPAAGTRIDAAINFDWGSGAPGVTGVGVDHFSVRWTGTLKVTQTGTYQFQTISDDGVRLWVNGTQILNNWTGHAATTDTSSTISLTAGTTYPLVLEYFESGSLASIQLYWKKPSDTAYGTIDTCPSVFSSYGLSPQTATAVTCAAQPITISTYDNLGSPITPPAGTQITLSTTPNTGTWAGGNTYTYTGTELSIVKYLQQTTAGSLNVNVTDGTYTESSSMDSIISFVNSGLLFSNIATQVAGTTSNPVPTIQAVKTDDNTGACVAQVSGTRSVNLAFSCRNPQTCAGSVFKVNGTSIASNPKNAASLTYTPVSLTFDNTTGIATIPLQYFDVGKVQLSAQLALSASGNDPAVTLSGTSNEFVVKPYTLAVSSITTTSGGANPGKTSQSGSANGFVPAGTAFKVNVEARDSAGGRTPNFGNEDASENNIKLVATQIYPSSASATLLNAGSGSFSTTTPTGTFTNSNVIWDQVGSITLQAQLSDSDYLAAGNIASLSTSGTVGRFYPDHYTLSWTNTINSCGTSLIYMDQPATTVDYQVQALSTRNTVLTNYDATYLNSSLKPYLVAENANSGVNIVSRLSALNAAATSAGWSSGVWKPTVVSSKFDRAASPDGPYSSVQLGVGYSDTFDGRSLTGLNMNATTTTFPCSGAGCTEVSMGSSWDVRFGRLRLDDAFGPETVALPVNFLVEYWTGNHFSINTADSCTKVPRSAISYPAGTLATDSNRTVSLGGGTTQGIYSYSNSDPSNIVFSSGSAGHSFTAPTGGAMGSFVVNVNLSSLLWLTYDWDQNGTYSETSIPGAHFSFGSYRGNDRVIYWREKLQ